MTLLENSVVVPPCLPHRNGGVRRFNNGRDEDEERLGAVGGEGGVFDSEGDIRLAVDGHRLPYET
ncbi:hypothetical protein MSG28_002267 [Choristoneura fumiferana]|uniref:Uncharacterized protein n=1 Tax=Choristoneura fumiferana TaxID=7141 RepID=A0ACC0JUV6_CHOFU|nr:hypothetical protein MSG28_002267 [Choristoneura fumiferana]